MSKKKKKKKKEKNSISLLHEVDKSLNTTYQSLQEEIEQMQLRLYLADQKARKKAKKKSKKNGQYFNYDNERKTAREEVLNEMVGTNFFDRIMHVLEDIAPVVVIIARLVASLILAILSLDVVKVNISPAIMSKINNVYKKAMLVSA